MKTLYITISLALALGLTLAIALSYDEAKASDDNNNYRLSTNREVSKVMPEVPVKVKLKKLADGKYTWEISGTNVQGIIDADSALRKYIKQIGLQKK